MSSQLHYHVYDIVLPDLLYKAKAIYMNPDTDISEHPRQRQLSNIKVLEDALLDEQQKEITEDNFTATVIPPDSDFYAHLLALRLGIDPPAKAAFILEHHRNNFAGNRYYTKVQFLQMVEFVVIKSVDHLKMPHTVERCNRIADWILEQTSTGNIEIRPTEHYEYWPFPVETLDALYVFLIKNHLIDPNPSFRESFRLYFSDSGSRTVWKGQLTLLVGLFYKIYGFKSQYNGQSLHTILSKLFSKESGADFNPRNLNQTLLNCSHKYETGIGMSKLTKVIFDFIDSLGLVKTSQ